MVYMNLVEEDNKLLAPLLKELKLITFRIKAIIKLHHFELILNQIISLFSIRKIYNTLTNFIFSYLF